MLNMNEELKKLVATQVNVADTLSLECGSTVFFLKPYDIVYVPRTGLADAAEVSRDLREVMMFRGWNINLSPIGNVIDLDGSSASTPNIISN